MRRYPGMRLPPGEDPVMRNELLKADRQLKQISSALAKSLTKGNQPVAIVSGGGGGNLPDHDHSITGQGGLVDHHDLQGLADDDHAQYSLVDGTRDFTGVVGGVTPTDTDHLVTKGYVDGLLTTTYYYPDSATFTNGTGAGTLPDDVNTIDGTDYTISEVAGAPGIDCYFEFSDVVEITSLMFYGYYAGSTSHNVAMQIYNFLTSSYDTLVVLQTNTIDEWFSTVLGTPANYVGTGGDAGKVRVRFYHAASGNTSHRLYIDYLSVVDVGIAGAAFVDHGGLTGLADNDHPQYTLKVDTEDLSGSGDVTTTTFYTSSTDVEVYRISAYLRCTGGSSFDAITATIGWNDGTAHTETLSVAATTGEYAYKTIVAKSAASQNMTYAVTRESTGSWELYLRVELL